MQKSCIRFYIHCLTFLLLLACCNAEIALAASKSKPFAIAFKAPKTSAKKLKIKGNLYCAQIKGVWQAASSVKKGKAVLLTSNLKNANKTCKSEGKKFKAGGITYINNSAGLTKLAAASTSEEIVRLTGAGVAYPIVYGLGTGSAGAIFELPNGLSIIEIASPPQTVAGEACYYALISASGALSCLSGLGGISGSSLLSVKAGRAFQSNTLGDVYFIGSTDAALGSLGLFKLTSAGNFSSVYAAPTLATLTGFQVLSDDSIVVSLDQANSSNLADPGYDVAPAVVHISASAVASTVEADTRTVSGKDIGWMHEFPDGSSYIGLSNYSNSGSLPATSAGLYRVAAGLSSLEHMLTPAAESICSGISTGPLCAYGASLIRGIVSTATATFAVAQEPFVSNLSSAVLQLYPTLSVLSFTDLTKPSGLARFGTTLLIAGQNGSSQGVLISYNTETLEENLLLSGTLIGDGPYYSARSNSFVAYGSDLSVIPAVVYAIQIPVNEDGSLGSLVRTAIPAAASISFTY